MNKAVLFLFLAMFSSAGFSSDYSGTPATGSKGEWKWSSVFAIRSFENGLILGVAFSAGAQCNSAYFMILGNDQINSIQLNIDGKKHSSMVTPEASALPSGDPLVKYKLSGSALRELKNGSSLTVETDKGMLSTSLSGSAYAFNMAYGNCMKGAGSTPVSSGTGTLQPSRKAARPISPQPKTHTTSSICDTRLKEYANMQAQEYERDRGANELTQKRAAWIRSNAHMAQFKGRSGNSGRAALKAMEFTIAQENQNREYNRRLLQDYRRSLIEMGCYAK